MFPVSNRLFSASCLILAFALGMLHANELHANEKPFLAGLAKTDITPTEFPVTVNGGFLPKSAAQAHSRLHARAIVLDDGHVRIAICVVDTCMMMRELIDEAKAKASATTGIAIENMLVSATHTHSAPSAMACLGVPMDTDYASFLTDKIAESIVEAAGKTRKAQVGCAVLPAWEYTHCRRWINRPDKMLTDPFGEVSVRANMHPGHQNANTVGPSGPVDPDLSILSLQTDDGKPLAILANFSMHYFGAAPLSADYFGTFANGIGTYLGADDNDEFLGIMSQGTSGDSQWMDYSQERRPMTSDEYADRLMKLAAAAYKKIEHQSYVSIAMAETKLSLRRRVADESRLTWARNLIAANGDGPPEDRPTVYAHEQLFIFDAPVRELKLQAVRIGELGITAIPNEVYAITGLKLKAQSPLESTFNIELANGSDGYIPPPEQHKLGGYTTWAARTAGLVPDAEPQIVEKVLQLLESVSGKERRPITDEHGDYAKAVLASKPTAYWRLNEFNPPIARDASDHNRDARYEDGIAMYLPGAQSLRDRISDIPEVPSNFSGNQINRAPHFAGGRLRAELHQLRNDYSVELWVWNGLPNDVRAVTGYLVSRGQDGDKLAAGDHLGIGGTLRESTTPGTLFVYNGNARKTILSGSTVLGMRTWHHIVMTREGQTIKVYLDGQLELVGEVESTIPANNAELFIGGRSDNLFNFEGKVDEVAVYDRVLTSEEVSKHFKPSGRTANRAVAANPTIATPPPTTHDRVSNDAAPTNPTDPPLSPEVSLKKLHLPAGFKAEIVAAEPLLLDPVAFDWDHRGRLWVVEMADYPLGMDGNGKPGGRVRVLEDLDADGRYDKSTLFADGLNFPNGILTWRDGVIVSAAPQILYLRDTDGDGVCDTKETLVDGLAEGNQQLRANGLRWGLDNWVYVASGSPNAKRFGLELKLKSTRMGTEVFVGGRDYRFKPDTGELEPTNGPTQFGRSRNNRGHWFGTQNSNPLWHYVVPDHYLNRNPHYGALQTVVQLLQPQNPPVYPASSLEKRFHNFGQSGHYTSACSGIIYRDNAMFESSRTHALVCEPFHNLVQHVSLTDAGVTFQAKQEMGDGKFDFFASEDRWCRPVMVREGPDGALWIADMYRYMIEHPQFLPPEGKAEMLQHYRRGDDLGRMYRISHDNMPAFRPIRMDDISTPDLVSRLDTTNGWLRDKVHQMLIWRADKSAIPALQDLVKNTTNELTRLHALCVLDGYDALSPELIAQCLRDPDAGVRENALRLAESRLTTEVLATAVRLANDEDPKVQMQLAFLLGESSEAIAGETLAELVMKHLDDPMMVTAVMSSAVPHIGTLARVASEPGNPNAKIIQMLLPVAIGLDDRDSLASLLSPIFSTDGERYSTAQIRAFAQLYLQLSQHNVSLGKLRTKNDKDPLNQLLARAESMIEQARADAMDSGQPELDRIAALVLLSREPKTRDEAMSRLADWLVPTHTNESQMAAVRGLSGISSAQVLSAFADAWPTMGPTTRQAMLDAWLSREEWAFDLVQRLENKELPTSALDPTNRSRLIKHDSPRIRELAEKVFDSASSNRMSVLNSYRSALTLTGDAEQGRQVFTKACAVCHQRGSEGRAIGPNMASVIEHSPEKLLGSILDPSADIQPGFNAYNCLLHTGELVYGLLVSESANSIVMLLNDGTRRAVLRSEIELLKGQNISLMPEGLEATIIHQQMADLIAFLKQPISDEKLNAASVSP